MDIVVFKEAFDWFVIRFCLSSLAVLAVVTLFLKLASLPSRLKINAKHFGWPAVLLFMVGTAWATFTAFPTQEEKQAYQEALQKQNAINQAWGDAMGLGNLDQGADIEPDAGSSQNEGIESSANTESLKEPERVTEDETVASDIDGLSITAFEIDHHSRAVALEATWREDVFDNAASHCLHLFMATNLQNRLWLPLGLIPVPSYTNVHAFAVTSNDVAEMSRAWFLEAFNGIGFYRLAVDVDSDGDGVADSVERLWAQTNPLCADSDADRLEDGIELSSEIGSNPLAYDTDGDGVGDGDEIAAGSNPRSIDSDGDGLSDAQEIGAMTAIKEDGFIWFDLPNGTRLITSQTADGNSWLIPLSQGCVINNVCYTNVKVHVDGTVHLLCPTNVNASSSACRYGSLENSEYSDCHVTVALYGEDLYARTNDWGSQILHGAVWIDGNVFTVVEYRNVGLYDFKDEHETATFQLIVPHHETNALYVSYLCSSNAFRTAEKIVGIQCGMIESQKPNERKYNLAWPLPDRFPEDGFTIKYSIGTGTDPIKADTDGDGLSDADEILKFGTNPFAGDVDGDGLLDSAELSVGTDPASPDTDNDGMPDGWEVLHSMNPLVDDSKNDADSDGVPNKDEYANGADPFASDTDGDDLPDAVESAWVDESASIPWFDMTDAVILSSASNKDSALYFCELPFTNRVASLPVSIAAADINGIVYFGNDTTTNKVASSNSARNMAENRSFPCVAVAPYWTDLYLRTSLNSQISHKTVNFEGQNYFVIQYSRVGIYRGNTNEVSFQVSIPENSPSNTVYVKYGLLADDRDDGYKVSIGAQTAHDIARIPVAYASPSHLCITNGTAFAYHFGIGSDPAGKDSDGDGVLDNLELQHGTNPASEDSDDDGLPDKWEIDHGVNPISSFGRHGADGDLDDDLLPNAKEYEYGTNPSIADTDGDGVGDGSETGSIIIANAVPWLSFDEADDVTTEISTNYRRCVNRPMPLPIIIQGETVTNMTISGNGIIFLNRAGYDNPGDSTSGENFKYEIDENALVIAPYLEYTYFRTDIPGRETAVKVGTSTYNGEGYLLLEFANAFRDTSTSRTNAISFQVAMPTNCPDHVYVRYKDISGLYMTGDYASIGMQTFDGSWLHSYCNDDSRKVWENLCLEFLFGSNSNPLVADTDEDGLLDGQEISIGISPVKTDTDGDGMNDGWEQRYSSNGFDPKENNSTDANPNNDLDADPDGDGLTNGAEVDAGTNPGEMDTDGDGLNDGVEVEQNSDPNDRADTIPVKWVSVTGDLEMGVAKQVRETVTIPAGTMAFVGVFIFSDEYPYYTDQASEFNDRVVWAVQANGNTTLEGMAHVNNEDGAWDAAGENGYDVNGFSPVVLKDKAIYRATGDADLPVNINIAAMNVSDGSLPTTVLVGVFPLKVVQANMPTGTGVAQTTDAATSYFRAFIPTNGVAYITAEPAAPQLTAQFKGLPQWINVKWSGSLSTERADRFTYDNRTLVEQVTHGGEGYNINDALNNEIVGGRCTLNASVDGVQISYPFSIRGKNPLDSVARAYITAQVPANTASYAWRISKHECKAGNATRFYNQFNPSRDSYKELPFKGNGANNWGWGLAQIDRGRNNANTSEIYDWRQNVDAMRAKLQEASNNTTRFIGYYSSAYSALPNWTEPPSTNINGQVVSGEIWSILTLYNGSGGIPGQTTPTRTTPFHSPLEFVPATGEWIFHTNSYNPNYVRDVLSDAELQEVE